MRPHDQAGTQRPSRVAASQQGRAAISAAVAAYTGLLEQVAAGESVVDLDAVPLAEVEKTWDRPSTTGTRYCEGLWWLQRPASFT
ncbi:MAG TPA: hypothetical protein VHY58_04245 [Streptosporangiaceae bacterium]|jgi:hypothetical protein|nr:hypothetical protein [Streptosporangiaceae bacterium]